MAMLERNQDTNFAHIHDMYRILIGKADDDNFNVLMNELSTNHRESNNLLIDNSSLYTTSTLMRSSNKVFINMLLYNMRFKLDYETLKLLEELLSYELRLSKYLCIEGLRADCTNTRIKQSLSDCKKRALIIENILKFNISREV